MTKIFVRERGQVGKGEGLPRFAVVGVQGSGLKFFQLHLRKSELDEIAKIVNAEVVILTRGTGVDAGEGSGGGKRKKRAVSKKRVTKGNA